MNNLVNGGIDESELRYVDLSSQEYLHYRLETGDVLFNRNNSYELVGRPGMYDLDRGHVFGSYLVRIKV